MTSERSAAPRGRTLPSIIAFTIIPISFCLAWPRTSAASPDNKRPASPSTHRLEAKLISVPLSFEPNQGQAASAVQFLSRGSGYALFLTPDKVVLNLERQQPPSFTAKGQTSQAASVD